jgi:redox-sensitive bicupin YhaK (pirin superfamily)
MKVVLDKAESRGYFDHGWLKTYHTFSFADYHNPRRMHFGKLRVLNDDTVAPQAGFDMHPHKNMEVVSIPLKGKLRHGDNIHNACTLSPGEIQVMSAGTGILHCEYNGSATEDLQFLQIWVFPRKEDTRPVYANYDIRPVLRRNEFPLIIAPDGEAPASIQQDAWFSLCDWDADMQHAYPLHRKDTGVYVFVIEGGITVSGTPLSKRDGAGFSDTAFLYVQALKPSTFLLMEVPVGGL